MTLTPSILLRQRSKKGEHMNRDEKELMIHDLTEQLAVEKEICKIKEAQIELLKLQRNLAMAALKRS